MNNNSFHRLIICGGHCAKCLAAVISFTSPNTVAFFTKGYYCHHFTKEEMGLVRKIIRCVCV